MAEVSGIRWFTIIISFAVAGYVLYPSRTVIIFHHSFHDFKVYARIWLQPKEILRWEVYTCFSLEYWVLWRFALLMLEHIVTCQLGPRSGLAPLEKRGGPSSLHMRDSSVLLSSRRTTSPLMESLNRQALGKEINSSGNFSSYNSRYTYSSASSDLSAPSHSCTKPESTFI